MQSRSILASLVGAMAVLTLSLASTANAGTLLVRQQQDKGTPLYLDEPSCDSYQCAIFWYPGDHVMAHWLDAPDGNVILDLLSNASTVLAHHIATVPGTTTNCDAEGESSCGQFSWIVPTEWQNGNYSLRASSESQPTVESYTDVILVMPANGTAASSTVAFSALDPTATATSTAGSPPTDSTATAANGSSSSTTASRAPTSAANASSAPSGGANAAYAPLARTSVGDTLAVLATACAAAALVTL